MNCPMHILIYKSQARSYRELPLRLFELGTVYRFERSGVLHGLTRVRGFAQDDAHIFVAPDQLAGELTSLLAFVLRILATFGLTDFEAELATRPEKFVGEPEEWDVATGGPAGGPGRRPGSPTRWPRARAPSTPPRSTSTCRTPSAGGGRSPPSRSTCRCRSASTWSSSAPTTSATGRS